MGYFDDYAVSDQESPDFAEGQIAQWTSKSKTAVLSAFGLLALPIPLSLASWIGTIMALAAIGMLDGTEPNPILTPLVAFGTMLIAGTYVVTYMLSLILTWRKKKLYWASALPLLHIGLFMVGYYLWSALEKI